MLIPSSVIRALAFLALAAAPAGADVAEYRVTFDATWRSATHSGAYPMGAHFSPLVGGTHNASISFWGAGSLASDAIEQMAEEGADGPLTSEVNAAISAGDAFSVISGIGIDSPGSTQATFFIDDAYPLVTLVTMVAPSPDWFVGISGVSLRSGGAWIDDLVLDLDPYDAGTDSGTDFNSSNQDTDPPDPIALLGAPFTGTPPLGTFSFERIIAECEDGIDNDGDALIDHGSDPGCDSPSDDSERSPSLVCDDGLDNDGDTFNDFPADPGCASPSDPDEHSLVACDDGLDNDGDMLIDYPMDPECVSPTDQSEETPPPPLAPTLSPAAWLFLGATLVAIGAAAARRRRS